MRGLRRIQSCHPALELNARDQLVVAEKLAVRVQIAGSNQRIHEAVVRIQRFDAISAVAGTCQLHASGIRHILRAGDARDGDFRPFHLSWAEVVLEPVAESLDQLTCPTEILRLLTQEDLKLRGHVLICCFRSDTEDRIARQKHASLIGSGSFHLRHHDWHGDVLHLRQIAIHVRADSCQLLGRRVRLPHVGAITESQELPELSQIQLSLACAALGIHERLLPLGNRQRQVRHAYSFLRCHVGSS